MTLFMWQRIILAIFGLMLLEARRTDTSRLDAAATLLAQGAGIACILAAIIGRLP